MLCFVYAISSFDLFAWHDFFPVSFPSPRLRIQKKNSAIEYETYRLFVVLYKLIMKMIRMRHLYIHQQMFAKLVKRIVCMLNETSVNVECCWMLTHPKKRIYPKTKTSENLGRRATKSHKIMLAIYMMRNLTPRKRFRNSLSLSVSTSSHTLGTRRRKLNVCQFEKYRLEICALNDFIVCASISPGQWRTQHNNAPK